MLNFKMDMEFCRELFSPVSVSWTLNILWLSFKSSEMLAKQLEPDVFGHICDPSSQVVVWGWGRPDWIIQQGPNLRYHHPKPVNKQTKGEAEASWKEQAEQLGCCCAPPVDVGFSAKRYAPSECFLCCEFIYLVISLMYQLHPNIYRVQYGLA